MIPRLAHVFPIFAAALVAVALGVACSGGKAGKASTPATPVTPSPVTTSAQVNIRTVNLAEQADVKTFAQGMGGEVLPEEIIYADLTADGADDAVVPISSGGSQGDVAFIVVGYQDGQLKGLFSDAPAGGEVRVSVENRMLVESLPVYSQGDQPRFPSHVKKIYYVWNGDGFVEDHQEIVAGQFPPA